MESENIFKRFIEIWKPNFLVKNFNTTDSSRTWKFWFLSNSIVTVILTSVVGFGIYKAINEAGGYLQENYSNAKISMVDGRLSTQGFAEPVFIESKEDNTVFVIDTQGLKYDQTVLDEYEQGVFISDTKIYNKKDSVKTEQFDLSKIKKNFTLTQQDLQDKKWVATSFFISLALFLFWIYFNVLRLVSALWWTLWFWLLGMIMKVENITFGKVYFSVLNFYIIPLSLSLALMVFGLNDIPLFTFVVLLIIFIINYLKLNKQEKTAQPAENDSISEIK